MEQVVDSTQNLHEVFVAGLAPDQPESFHEGYSVSRQMDIVAIRKYLNDERVVIALKEMLLELERAEEKHPVWPTDLVHAASIMVGEAGECQKAANHFREGRTTEGRDSLFMTRREGVQTGAMVIRMLINLPSKQELLK